MSFQPKTDYIGIGGTGLELKANADGASNGNLEIVGQKGDIICNQIFGQVKAPTCEYAITAKTSNFKKTLGKCHGTNPYALQSYTIATGAGQEPTFNASSVQIESGATQAYCTYEPTAIEISPARHASDFGALSAWTESCSLTLQNSTYTVACDLSPSTINGEPVASDAVQGKETLEVTFWTNSDTAAPNVQPKTGWRQTVDWACTGADSSMFSWTATFEHYLSATEHA